MHINIKVPPGTPDRISAAEFQSLLKGKYEPKGNPFPKGTGGKREDLGGKFFRSMMEANMARYYNFFEIRWKYEPCEFKFPIERGIRFYKPDFLLIDTGVYVECKGWFDAKSKTRMKRMKKYYPDVQVQLILWSDYKAIEKSIGMLIPGWE